MAEERNPQTDGLSTEPPPPIDHDNSQLRDPPVPDNHQALNLSEPPPSTAAPQGDGSSMAVDNVLHSEIGVNTLLGRLKQSIASSRDFATFLKKRSTLEEEQAQGLKKLCRTTHEINRRPDSRQGSYAAQFDEAIRIHDRMTENGMQFALLLHQMHEELLELTTTAERGRKHWKQAGLAAEKRVQDAELAMEKAKAKYDSLAEDYDRARTGDRHSSKKFGLKGPKSAAQYEEDLLRKVQTADADYSSKVQSAQSLRQELLTTLRPQALRALQDLIMECDSATALQLQKFASFNEKLLLNNGLCVSPLKAQADGPQPRSLREIVYQIDNESDLKHYIISFSGSVPAKRPDIRYERHPTLVPQQQVPAPMSMQTPQQPPPSQQGPPSFPMHARQSSQPQSMDSFNREQPAGPQQFGAPPYIPHTPSQQTPTLDTSGPPQIPPQFSQSPQQQAALPVRNGSPYNAEPPPAKPVFGVPLKFLVERDGSAVPMVVYQCIQAIDLYGLEVDGLYRRSGTSSHVTRIKGMFDHDASALDFRNPEHFYHDVNSVTGVLKQFFRELPTPLLSSDPPGQFLDAGRKDDDEERRNALHAHINALEDPEYATLRALTLHLWRVQKHEPANRMTAEALAIIFAPTLMGSDVSAPISDASYQVRAVKTILLETPKIFDED